MDLKSIITLIGSSVAAIIIIVLFSYFVFFRKRVYKKQLRELDRKFQYLHSLLNGQVTSYIKRIEIISRTNLLYVDIHSKHLKKYKDLRDKHDVDSEHEIAYLRDLLEEHHYKKFKSEVSGASAVIDNYDVLLSELNCELTRVVKPEEDCRQSALQYKEKLRLIKQDYYSKEGQLTLMVNSFEEVFKFIDSLFDAFEAQVESANYDDANGILPKIDEILHEINATTQELPNLCALISTVVPQKIDAVSQAYRLLKEEKYPLYHLFVEQTLQQTRDMLQEYTKRIRRFDIRGIHEALDETTAKLDKFFDAFKEEKEARQIFESKNDNVYSVVNLIEKKFIKLRNTIPEVSKIFVINGDHRTMIDNIQNEINKVGALKRSLDTFIHSTTKQPYSSLVAKMNELEAASNSIISEIDEYNSYLSSLKTDAEKAYGVVYSFYEKVKKAERLVREINVKKTTEKYSPKFEEIYRLLNQINDYLITEPIDIDGVNSCLHDLYEIANVILDDGEVAEDYGLMTAAEKTIIYSNRHRYHFENINEIIQQAEQHFINGDFEQSYVCAGNALAKVKEENGR